MVTMVQCWIDVFCVLIFSGLLVVRSGLITSQWSPRSFERSRNCEP